MQGELGSSCRTVHAVAGFNSEVQCGHRVALIEMVDRQNAHSRGAGAGSSCLRFILLICLITRKITKPTIRKSITVPRNNP
jgi:hypothetical protein